MQVLSMERISECVRELLRRYKAEYALLFGSYARGDADGASDIDLIVFGGANFIPRDILPFAEDLREMTGKDADVFEIREVDAGTAFFKTIQREGIRIA